MKMNKKQQQQQQQQRFLSTQCKDDNVDLFSDDSGAGCNFWSTRDCSTAQTVYGHSKFSQTQIQCNCRAACNQIVYEEDPCREDDGNQNNNNNRDDICLDCNLVSKNLFVSKNFTENGASGFYLEDLPGSCVGKSGLLKRLDRCNYGFQATNNNNNLVDRKRLQNRNGK